DLLAISTWDSGLQLWKYPSFTYFGTIMKQILFIDRIVPFQNRPLVAIVQRGTGILVFNYLTDNQVAAHYKNSRCTTVIGDAICYAVSDSTFELWNPFSDVVIEVQ